ncbi:response regulator transcription factor [Mucilaginibacter sp. UYCu711]|uniref:response regulator transcription factor n=1 Tax=Mucilaginibacter sp. UYCu711 TaxID=3156339 RepID=UPI003D1EE2F9
MKGKILVLEDDEDIVSLITIILEDNGYEIKALLSGDTVFEEIDMFKPNLVLMDIMLGTMDGREICRKIKSVYRQPVILISASYKIKSTLKPPGAPDDFIAKPFDIDHLLFKVAEHCAITGPGN